MGLKEQLEETRRLRDEALEREAKEAEVDTVETEEEVEKVEEKTEEVEAKVEEIAQETDEERKARNAEFAQMRRELKENQRQLKEIEDRRAAEALVPQEEAKPKGNPYDPAEDVENYLRWEAHSARELATTALDRLSARERAEQQQFLMRDAANELGQHIARFREKQPDFDEAAEYGQRELRKAYRLAGFSPKQIDEKMDQTILGVAARAATEGNDPAAALYRFVQDELGYQRQEKAATSDEDESDEKKPNLDKVAENRARSAGMAGAKGGRGGGDVSRRSIATMSNAEWKALSSEEKKRLMAG